MIYTINTFVNKAQNVHGQKYDYSHVQYVNAKTPVEIVCNTQGSFLQKPQHHLNGHGCPCCKKERLSETKKMSVQMFIKRAKTIHGNLYDYSLLTSDNFGYKLKIPIICNKHGVFYQLARHHLSKHGCPKCNQSKLESSIEKLLADNNIVFIQQYKQKYLGKMSLDFYLPNKQIAIECQGIQHFKPINHFGGDNALKDIQRRDFNKFDLCIKHGILVIYYSEDNIKFPYNVFTSKSELLNFIEKWDGKLPDTYAGGNIPGMILNK